jgi:hypothetical protein
MGYDINVGTQHIYLTYNHYGIFKKYNIYPREFNDMKVKEIISFYKNAIEHLEKLYPNEKGIFIALHTKYHSNELYENDERIVLRILYNLMDVLENYCKEYDIWKCD